MFKLFDICCNKFIGKLSFCYSIYDTKKKNDKHS